MRFHGNSNDDPLFLDYAPMPRESPVPVRPTRRRLLRWVTWLWERFDDGLGEAPPSRVFYQFEAGSWRSRSTRQLGKVSRCR